MSGTFTFYDYTWPGPDQFAKRFNLTLKPVPTTPLGTDERCRRDDDLQVLAAECDTATLREIAGVLANMKSPDELAALSTTLWDLSELLR